MYLTGSGMVCAVGLSAVSACAAMRAGIANFVQLPYHDNQGEPVIGAPVPGLPFTLNRHQRLLELLSMAVTDCLNRYSPAHLNSVPLLVAFAETGRPGGGAESGLSIIRQLQQKL